ncbi:MAG: cobalt-precorrin-6A reductase [Cumulibacter sp.]
MRVLILGGTAEARELAAALVDLGVPVISSLAGRVQSPRLPAGEVRIGGFGGVEGLAAFLQADRITHVIDATHPFAQTMTRHGADASDCAGVPFVRYARPGWRARSDSASWTWVRSYDEARVAAQELGAHPFLTTGRQTLPHFLEPWAARSVLVRVVEPLSSAPPTAWRVLLDRGPYTVDGELAVMRQHEVDALLTKDSGGSYTAAKLDAAASLGVPIVVVGRPEAPVGVREVPTLHEALSTVVG